MGMYDYIIIDDMSILPCSPEDIDLLKAARDGHFQTKDTPAQHLEPYFIIDGYLYYEEGTYELTPKHERPYPDAPDHDFRAFCGIMRKVEKSIVRTDFSGEIVFYCHTNYRKPNQRWHEFFALFDQGKLLRIEEIRKGGDNG